MVAIRIATEGTTSADQPTRLLHLPFRPPCAWVGVRRRATPAGARSPGQTPRSQEMESQTMVRARKGMVLGPLEAGIVGKVWCCLRLMWFQDEYVLLDVGTTVGL